MKLNRLTGFSLVALATAPVAACGPKPNPTCDSGVWSPVVNGCVRPCGTRENPTYDDCYDTDAGVFIEAGSDRDARADGAAMDAVSEAGRDVVSLPDADAAMEAAVEAGPACTAPEVDCAGACVSTESSLAHCGACGRACTTSVANARPVCAMGVCDFECAAGFELVGAACEVRVPRAIGPMTSATVTSQRPTLEWALPTGVTMATVDLCRDRAMTMGCTTLSATGSTVRPASALTAGVWFWRVRGRANGTLGTRTSPVWWFRVGHGDAAVDTFHGVELDVNGDGYGDVAVGAPGASPGGRANAGAVYVYFGGASGLSATPSQTLEGTDAFAELGRVISAAGDVNGDGFGDLLVAQSRSVSGRLDSGTVFVFLGGALGVRMTPGVQLDGSASQFLFGSAVSAAGDVNGDGFGDVLVGANAFDDFGMRPPGTASVFLGSATGPSTMAAVTWAGTASNDLFGSAVAHAGDVDGDRIADVVVGQPSGRNAMMRTVGAVQLFKGRRGTLVGVASKTWYGQYDGGAFGRLVASAGDVDADGLSDVLVASALGDVDAVFTGVRTVYCFRGSATTLADASMSRMYEAAANSLGRFGDMNRDGRDDAFSSSENTNAAEMSYAGTARVFLSTSTGVPLTADHSVLGTMAEQYLGTRAGSIDADNDGLRELIVTEQSSMGRPWRLFSFETTAGGALGVGRALTLPGIDSASINHSLAY